MTHQLEVVRDEQRKRGWYLSWRCAEKRCGTSGNATTPSRETGMELLAILQAAHAQRDGRPA